jgi:serine/threonine protein kinase
VISEGASLPLEDKLSIMGQVSEGILYAHQRGIVHRDIKPGYIMLRPSGHMKILDLGVARIGVHDMAGNVIELVADWFGPGYYRRSPERNPRGPERRFRFEARPPLCASCGISAAPRYGGRAPGVQRRR